MTDVFSPSAAPAAAAPPGRETPRFLHQFFEKQASARPDQIAIVTPGRIITYKTVEESANRLARYLRARGVGPGCLVGLLLPRSTNVYVGILAILKAGAGYVPLDPDYPKERVSYILNDCKAIFLVTVAELVGKAEFPGSVVLLDAQADDLAKLSADRLTPEETGVSPTDIAYIIYTSGSTGKPKGVEIEHQSVCNLVQVELGLYAVRADDRIFQGFSIAFDASVEEVWMAFAPGATLVIGTSEMMHAGPALSEILTENRITFFSTVPTLLSMLDEDIPTLRILILGGEACPPDLVQRWAKPTRRMFNTYGPTEATVICTSWECVPGKPVTIGPPLPTYTIYLLDENMQRVPPGTPGELYIGGVGVARGYVGRPDLTAERFIANPFSNLGAPPRLYRTGDMGRWTTDGEIEYLGRADTQVKIRGFRVELSEIEAVLLECPLVQAAVVAVHTDPGGMQQLIGYVIIRDGKELEEEAIRSVLRARLPYYMVPTILEPLANFPTLPSGKVDRRSLPAPRPRVAPMSDDPNRQGPRTDLEKQIAEVWEGLFAPRKISIKDDFFLDLGGHSLLAARMTSQLRKNSGLGELAVLDVYKHSTIASLAAHVEKRRQAAAAKAQDPTSPSPDDAGPSQFHPISPRTHRLCGLAQLPALYVILASVSLQLLVPYLTYTLMVAARRPIPETLLVSLASAMASYPLMLLVSIIVKWVVIGRFQPGFYPLWGTYYYRWWLVKSILAVVPKRFLAGTPLLNIYYRLLGADIGKSVYLGTDEALAFDLLHIGDGAHIGPETSITGCVVEDGLLKIGHIDIGKNCFVGARCVLRPGAIMSEGSSLEDLSLLRSENRIRAGKRRYGSPAVPLSDNQAPVRSRDSFQASATRRMLFGLFAGLGVFAFPAIILAAIVPGMLFLEALARSLRGNWYFAFIPLVAIWFVLLFLGEIALLKWLLLGRVKPGRYPLYGWFHLRKWFIDHLLDLVLDVLLPIHASLYQTPWFRLLGAKIGRHAELSTAVHFSPDLMTVGEGSFVADSVSFGSARVDGGYLTIAETRIGNKTFIGNSSLLPGGANVGDDCLIGVLSTTPLEVEEAARSGVTWIGSPAFVLPRRQQSTEFAQEQTFKPTTKLRTQRALIEAIRILLPLSCVIALTCILMNVLVSLHRVAPLAVVLLVAPLVFAACGVAACLFAIAVKWLVIGRYKPREAPLWSPFVWATELASNICEWLGDIYLVRYLLGTPHVCWFFRLLGARIGRRVYMDTTEMTEYDLVEIGDEVALNDTCTLQTHLFEDRVMKLSYVRIGNRCTIGAGATVLYDTYMADGSSLEELSLLMKGEVLPAGTAWTGIPAIPATKSAEDEVYSTLVRAQPEGLRTVAASGETMSRVRQQKGEAHAR
ncbi:MAG: amino acid adenylation domain-containing protein [Planctomycetes bacterium]|nr:amino acid adenylation domain-containing protein [Planctomycetota bacterium]